MPPESDQSARATAEAVARRGYGKLVAYLPARTRDVAAAEDALSEAFAAALTHWSASGAPRNPEAWLLTVARREMIDAARRSRRSPGPAAGLALLNTLADDPRFADYQPFWAARAQLLARTGETDAADRAYATAIGLESDPAVRRFLQRRRAALGAP